jgi:8-oxo-dGTP diphosphatase
MTIGRFYGGVGALIHSPRTNNYLILKRSESKDFAPGVWECVTGRVDQGEGFEDAVRREVIEELGVRVSVIEFIIGTTHFYRGKVDPENELIGVVYSCALDEATPIRISREHSEYRWLPVAEVDAVLGASDPSTRWLRRVIERAEIVQNLLSNELVQYYKQTGFELG